MSSLVVAEMAVKSDLCMEGSAAEGTGDGPESSGSQILALSVCPSLLCSSLCD